jgi:hypothetical protein
MRTITISTRHCQSHVISAEWKLRNDKLCCAQLWAFLSKTTLSEKYQSNRNDTIGALVVPGRISRPNP